ncbi:ATP-binding protein [Roseateles sp. BYS180W]|uniref:histidine kinase n=1 Tax=Roseateles rivi TaxID=3299028 RepID=A0ABW7FTB2_9BURK
MSRIARWAWLTALLAACSASGLLAFLLSVSTSAQRGFFERHYVWLFWANVAMATVLLAVIVGTGVQLLLRVRRGRFGSRLLLKLAAIFAMVGLVPGVLTYAVSYQFVNRSIENWFDQRLAGALDAGLNLGRSTLDGLVADLGARTRSTAERWTDMQSTALGLERVREQLSAQSVALLGANGQVLVNVTGDTSTLLPERPRPSLLRQAHASGLVAQLEGLDDEATALQGQARVRAIALLPTLNLQLTGGDRYLMVVRQLPSQVVANALAVQAANAEYQQRALERDGLRRMVLGTLTLVLVLSVFAAVLLAVALGRQLAQPLLLLAEGVRQVAQGDLRAKPVFASRDELGGLTRSFADMTQQLADARALVQRSVSELESAHTHLQTILDNLTAGVIVFDAQRRIATVNPGTTRILRSPMSAYTGRLLEEVPGLSHLAQHIWQRFDQQPDEPGARDHWQDALEHPLDPQHTLTLLMRGATLPHDARLIVFDDISEVVSAQRSAAWAEVARRLAHEIKNPLTPIQLSAERLQHKLADKLEGTDQAMLIRAVGTIVNQVQAMKQLVNEFRDYARLPAVQLQALDLNALISEVLALYAQEQEQGRLRCVLASTLPAILGDATQLRQVIHNLVQNALDAVAERPDGHVLLSTEARHAPDGRALGVRLLLNDNGPGFAQQVLQRAFEPYVTTKVKGTGLGLAVVKKICDEHGARIRLSNLSNEDQPESVSIGAQVSISFSKLAPVQSPIQEPSQSA